MSFLVLALALALEPIDDEVEEYPVEYRGTWAPTIAKCNDENDIEFIIIGRTKIWAYEADSKLLKLTPTSFLTAPNGKSAKSITALVAERGESELGIGQIRLTLSGDKLYTSRADVVSEDEQWKYSNIRCPAAR